jgi:hypothetical protein
MLYSSGALIYTSSQASPEEVTNAPTEEQDKDLHEEEGASPSSPVISTAPSSSQD